MASPAVCAERRRSPSAATILVAAPAVPQGMPDVAAAARAGPRPLAQQPPLAQSAGLMGFATAAQRLMGCARAQLVVAATAPRREVEGATAPCPGAALALEPGSEIGGATVIAEPTAIAIGSGSV